MPPLRTAARCYNEQTMKKLILQFIRFSFVGLTAFAIDYILFLVLEIAGVPYLIANIISYVIATIYNFLMSMRYVFPGKTGQTRMQQFIIFTVLSIIGLGLNELFLFVFVHFAAIPAWFSKIMSTFLVMIFNFITRKYFLEDRKPKQEKEVFDTLVEGTNEVFGIIDDMGKTFIPGQNNIAQAAEAGDGSDEEAAVEVEAAVEDAEPAVDGAEAAAEKSTE